MIILIYNIPVRISLFDVVYKSRSFPKKRNIARTFEYLRWKQWLSCFYFFHYCGPVCPKYKVKHVKLQMIAVIEGEACHGLNSGLYIWNGSFSCVPKDIWGQQFMLGFFKKKGDLDMKPLKIRVSFSTIAMAIWLLWGILFAYAEEAWKEDLPAFFSHFLHDMFFFVQHGAGFGLKKHIHQLAIIQVDACFLQICLQSDMRWFRFHVSCWTLKFFFRQTRHQWCFLFLNFIALENWNFRDSTVSSSGMRDLIFQW